MNQPNTRSWRQTGVVCELITAWRRAVLKIASTIQAELSAEKVKHRKHTQAIHKKEKSKH